MEPVLVKIGGELAEQEYELSLLADWLLDQNEQGNPVVLVHGGGIQVDELSNKLGLDVNKHQGRRVTDPATRDLLVQVVGGAVNKKLVSELRGHSLNAVGLTAADGEMTTARRRSIVYSGGEAVDFGLVGDITRIDLNLLHLLLGQDYLPVVGCVSWSHEEGLLNINADTLATALAAALGCRTLCLLTTAGGVRDEHNNLLGNVTPSLFEAGQRDGWISRGMIPKLQNGFEALKNGVRDVLVCAPADLAGQKGTRLTLPQDEKIVA